MLENIRNKIIRCKKRSIWHLKSVSKLGHLAAEKLAWLIDEETLIEVQKIMEEKSRNGHISTFEVRLLTGMVVMVGEGADEIDPVSVIQRGLELIGQDYADAILNAGYTGHSIHHHGQT